MKNIIESKSYDFAKRIVNACRLLMEKKHEFVLSKQLPRSGMAIGALIREAEHAENPLSTFNFQLSPSQCANFSFL